MIAHEIGHHVQNLLGVMEDVDQATQENPDDRNELSVRLELQADCLAGIWAHSAFAKGDLLESGRPRGRAQRRGRRRRRPDPEAVRPRASIRDSFTHGTSEQRVKWFRAGFDSGDPTACDTFEGDV